MEFASDGCRHEIWRDNQGMLAPNTHVEVKGDRAHSPLSVRRITSYERFCAHASEWRALAAQCAPPTLIHDYDFVASWWKVFGNGIELLVATTENGGWLGALPVLVSRERYHGVELRVLSCIDNGYIPTCRALLHPEHREAAFGAISQHLLSFATWDLVRFPKLPAHCLEQTVLAAQAQRLAIPHGTRANLTTPVIRLLNGWGGLLQARSKGFRKQLRNKCNRFRRTPGARIQAHPFNPDRAPALIEAMNQVSAASWKHSIGTDLSADERAPRFLNELSLRLGSSERATAWFAYLHDRPIAFELNLHYRGVSFPIRADFDERYRDLSPGFVLMTEVLSSLARQGGERVYYSCANAYDYLLRWTDETVVHETLEVFARRLRPLTCHLLSHHLAPRLRGVRKLAWRARDRVAGALFRRARLARGAPASGRRRKAATPS